MAISQEWLPVITSVISWIKDAAGPSKKTLRLEISELEKKVQELSAGNAVLENNVGLIMQALLEQLSADSTYNLNVDTVVFIGDNSGAIEITNPKTTSDIYVYSAEKKQCNLQVESITAFGIFDGLDEEIEEAKRKKPSDRR